MSAAARRIFNGRALLLSEPRAGLLRAVRPALRNARPSAYWAYRSARRETASSAALMTVALVQRRTRCVGGLARSRGIPPPAPTPRESAPLSRARYNQRPLRSTPEAQPLSSASLALCACHLEIHGGAHPRARKAGARRGRAKSRETWTLRWREPDSNLYGAFPVKPYFWFVAGSLFGAGKPFFVPSPAMVRGARRKGSRDRNGSKAWWLAA